MPFARPIATTIGLYTIQKWYKMMILDKLQRKLHLKVCLFDGINSFPVLTELHKNRSIFHNTPYNEFTKFGTFHNFLPYTVSDSRVKWAILARISTISTRQIWHKIFSLKKFAYEIMNFLPYSFTFSGFAHRQTKLKDTQILLAGFVREFCGMTFTV